jgi:hypothetical protein
MAGIFKFISRPPAGVTFAANHQAAEGDPAMD